MFIETIEEVDGVVRVVREDIDLHLFVERIFTKELKIDQNAVRNGVCLTVVATNGDVYQVTAIVEILAKTHLGSLQAGDIVNLERGILLNTRLGEHIVQGHIDRTATCMAIRGEGGSKRFSSAYDPSTGNVVIEKGSVTVNRINLTVVDVIHDGFSVAVIPYILVHTNLHCSVVGSAVNLELDVIGKYVARLVQQR